VWEVTRVNLYYIAVLVAVLLLITYVPQSALFLVDMFYR
jgi:C4-dicarboxylate transporter, DctM subunit